MTDRDDPRAAQALDEMETRLREGELHLARRALDATRALCGSGERARFEALEERLGLLERLEGPALDHDAAMARGDLLAARDAAARAASVAGGEEAAPWRARAEDAGARVRAEWRIREAELDAGDGGAALAACAGVLEPTLGEALPVVADDGATLVLVAAWERWVFVREIDLRHRRLRRIGWLRTPEPLEDALVQVEGNSIHLVGSAGHLLSLSRRPLEVIRWVSLRPFMLPDPWEGTIRKWRGGLKTSWRRFVPCRWRNVTGSPNGFAARWTTSADLESAWWSSRRASSVSSAMIRT
jgi:hypothetical protein